MRYLKSTSNHGLIYGKAKVDKSEIIGYEDADFVSDLDSNKSITSYLFHGL